MFSFQAVFLVIYYVNVARLSPLDVGILLLVVRFWSAACDLIAGRIVDSRATAGDRFRPFLLWATPPLLLAAWAVFSVPDVDSYGVRLAWAWASSAVMLLFYSLVTIPYMSLASAMTADPVERVGLNSYRMGAVMLVQLGLAALVAPQITRLGHDPGALQGFFTGVAGVFVVVGMALYWFCHRTTREQHRVPHQPLTLGHTVASVRGNRPLLVLCTSSTVLLTGQFTIVGAQAHYATLALGDSGILLWMTAATAATSLLMTPLAPRLVARWGTTRVYLAMAVVSALGALGIALAPRDAAFVVACFAVQGFGMGPLNALMYALAAESVDHGHRASGMATPGAVYAVYQLSRKVSQAFAGGLVGWGLAVAGISATTQPGDPGASALVWLVSLLPAALIVVGGLLMLPFPRRHDAPAR